MNTIKNKTLSIKGKKWVSKNKKTIYQYDINSELIAIYDSIEEAAKFTGLNRTTITRNIQKENSSVFYIWSDKLL